MALSSASTLAAVEAAYDDNASYAEDGSVTKAKAFITACRILLRRLPTEAGTRESHIRLSPDLIRKEMTEAQAYVTANDTTSSSSTPRVTRIAFDGYRG